MDSTKNIIVCFLEWMLSYGRNSSELPPPAVQSSLKQEPHLRSHGWLHARCSHSAHLQAHTKNNGNPIVHVSWGWYYGPRALEDQHKEQWEVEQLLPAQASGYAYCNLTELCSKPCVPHGQDQPLFTTELPWSFWTGKQQPKSSGAALFKPNLYEHE